MSAANREGDNNNMQCRIGNVEVKQETQDHEYEANYDEKIAALERKALDYHKLICELKIMKRSTEATAMAESNGVNAQTEIRALAQVEDGVLKHMLDFIGNNNNVVNGRGFVYGIIPEKGDPVSGSSDNLRSWWMEQVNFCLTGPSAIARYRFENSMAAEYMYGMNSTITTPRALNIISDITLRSMLSALMAYCNPPQRDYPFCKGCPPPWWPKGDEEWYSRELAFLRCDVPPYRRPCDLKKACKVVLMTALMKHFFPDIRKMRRIINEKRSLCDKMSARESYVWCKILEREQAFADRSRESTDGYNGNVKTEQQRW